MNQILYMQNKKSQPTDIKKIIIFFAIAIIIFGIVLLGQGSYVMFFKNNDNVDVIGSGIDIQKPQLDINKQEESVIIAVNHNKPITDIIYKWNYDQEQHIDTNNETSIVKEINLPIGTNKLYIRITDVDNQITEFEKEYVLEGNGKPIISLAVTKDDKIKIVAKDEQALRDIVYTWNNGQQTRVEANLENLRQIEKEVEIPLGQNTFKVTATNTNDITTTKELEVKGIKKPVVLVQKDGDSLIITAEDEVCMKLVNYTLNGKQYQLNFGDVKVIKYKQKLDPGENLLILTAENKDGGVTEYKGRCVY